MRLAMAISPSRESSSTEPMSRRYMRTGIVGALGGLGAGLDHGGHAGCRDGATGIFLVAGARPSASAGVLASSGSSLSTTVMPMSDSIDMVSSDLLGGDFLRRQHGIEFVVA